MSGTDDQKELLIIDTDCGVDDAMAILLALSFDETFKIIAVTCCEGNTTVENSSRNVLKLLNCCGKTDIPVYTGCRRALLGGHEDAVSVHGDDGLGNFSHRLLAGSNEVREGHAVNVLIELSRKYRQRINLIALAPLTNIALAIRMDPEFTANLKSMVIMGGNYKGVGNSTSAAEFNFLKDPEAADIVLSETLCATTLVPWETTLDHPMTWKFYDEWVGLGTSNANFLKGLTDHLTKVCKSDGNPGFVTCDFQAMAAILSPGCVAGCEKYPVTVETSGRYTRGQAVVHRLAITPAKALRIRIVTAFDDVLMSDLYNRLLKVTLKQNF